MIVIFGNGYKNYIEVKGKFICPNSNLIQINELKTSNEFFKLLYIPILPISKKKLDQSLNANLA